MPPKTQSITSNNGLFRVEFRWSEDRFRHSIQERIEDEIDEWRVLLESCDGDPSQSWPPSPPYQEVEPHISGSGRTSLLAVGLAGTSHWSAAVEEVLVGDATGSAARIRFDVACRLKEPNASLQSTYRMTQHYSMSTEPGVLVCCNSAGPAIQLISESAVDFDEKTVTVSPRSIPEIQPATARWMYDLLITQAP